MLTTDDIASAPRDQREQRRGVAGNVFIFKAAGAAADLMMPLDVVERVARHANARTYTLGVALAPCSLPQTRRANFEIAVGEMEIGMGIHGEPGMRREALRPADAVVDEMMDAILAEMSAARGDRVAVLVNSLGATPLMELYIMNRRVAQRLAKAGLIVHRTLVGPLCTSLEMAGASITVMHLDEELQRLLDHPCECAMYQQGGGRC
jgi:dihydroxyacetone kinase-like protein